MHRSPLGRRRGGGCATGALATATRMNLGGPRRSDGCLPSFRNGRLATGVSILLLLGACGGGTRLDRIAAVSWECELRPENTGGAMELMLNLHGCSAIARQDLGSSVLKITVRRPSGETYVVSVDPYDLANVHFRVGDAWTR